MSDQQLFESLGRKQLVIEQQDQAYTNLLNLLAGVVAGQIDPARILVNVTDRTWLVAPEGQRPSLPATVNGNPVCVVSPAKDVVAEQVEAILASRNGAADARRDGMHD